MGQTQPKAGVRILNKNMILLSEPCLEVHGTCYNTLTGDRINYKCSYLLYNYIFTTLDAKSHDPIGDEAFGHQPRP